MFPQADGLARYWANIRKCIDAITEVPESHWKLADYYDRDPQAPDRTYAHRGGFLTPVDFPLLDFGISPNSVEATDTAQLLGLLVAREALDDAGYPFDGELDRDRVNVILGVTGTLELVIPLGARLGHPIWRRALQAAGVDEHTALDVINRIAASYVGWQENSFPGLLGNVAAGRIANRLDLRGTNCVVDAACASSLAALNLALLELAADRCDIAVTGGLDAFNDIFMYMCFSKTPALSPTGDARPFDAQADGTVLGEGLGIMVLKRLEDARRDNDRIYAVIRSIGTSSDGIGQAVYAPSSAGQARALKRAYQTAAISPATVELVEAHGTGTRVGDASELVALDEIYRGAQANSRSCAIGSVKSQVGHTKAAAGAAGMIKTALALYHKVLPPTTKVSRPIEPLLRDDSPFYLNALPRPWLPRPDHPRRAAVSAFGFGGSNFHCLLEEADPEKPGVDWDGDVQIVAVSADNPAALATALRRFQGLRDWSEICNEAANSRLHFNAQRGYRTVLVTRRDGTETAALAAQAIAHLERLPSGSAAEPAAGFSPSGAPDSGRVFSGTGRRPGLLAMLFPGQGSQYVGMLRELACQFPEMQRALARFNQACGGSHSRLSDAIYPPPAFDEKTGLAQEVALRDTRIAQPAIGAISSGGMRILEAFGVRPDLAGGHSFGELAALCAGGRIDDGDLANLACRRGELMAECARSGEPGAMLAVFTTLDQLNNLLREGALDLVIANRNAPRQHVLAGSRAEIERARELCAARRIANAAVAVSAAFHSPHVADAHRGFSDALRSIEPRVAAIPVFANKSGLPYPDDVEELRELLASQLVEPVQFESQIEQMYRRGARVFVEVGPDTKLTGLVSQILEGRGHTAISLDRSRGSAGNVYDLACLLASLAALGYAVDVSRWDAGPKPRANPRKQRGLTAKISGANAKPKNGPAGDPPERPRFAPPQPSTRLPLSEPESPMFAHGASRERAPFKVEPRKNGVIDSAADFSTRMNTKRAESDAEPRQRNDAIPVATGEMDAATPAVGTQSTAPDVLRAFQTAQENLLALQRLAAQTAQVHQQFLEGQERIQQTFVKLLEQGQRVGRELPRSERPASSRAAEILGEARQPASACNTTPPVVFPDSSDRNGATERFTAANPIAAPKPEAIGIPPAVSATGNTDAVARAVIEVVSDKTGYPPDVLGLDMKLDADLGIDSIKRVEILSALHERLPALPTLAAEQVGALGTLRAIVELVALPDSAGESQSESPVNTGRETLPIGPVLIEIVAEKTGYPVDMLELDMQLDADLGIDSIKRVEILSALQDRVSGLPTLKPEQLGQLRTLRAIAGALAIPGDTDVAAQPTLSRHYLQAIPLGEVEEREDIRLPAGGMIAITADGSALGATLCESLIARGFRATLIAVGEPTIPDLDERVCGLIILGPRRPAEGFMSQAFRVLRALGPALESAGRAGGASLLTVSRLDGRFGVMGLAARVDPVSGALAGLAKTAVREWTGVHCKAVDLEAAIDDSSLAAAMIVEEFLKRGPAEIGLTARERFGLELVPVPEGAPAARRRSLEKGDVFVISGGARGVTAAVARALASAFQPRLVLLGRSPEPKGEDPGLSALQTEAELKRGLLERLGRQVAPSELGARARQVLIAREIRQTIHRIEAAGSPVRYYSLDVRDRGAVCDTLQQIRADWGPIRGLIHGAGALADRRIIDQTDGQFNLVFDTKVKGLDNLLHGINLDELWWLIVFSSSTARFGRIGQVAYAAANEALNKWAQRLSVRLPSCRVISYNWGPWDGGMVTDELKPIFAREGIALIPPAAGAELVVRDIERPDTLPAEIVVLAQNPHQPLQARQPNQMHEPDAVRLLGANVWLESSSDTGRNATTELRDSDRQIQRAGNSSSSGKLETAFRREVSLETIPVLASHVIDGHPVVPMALILEWLAEGAAHRNPGLVVAGVDDMKLFKGVILNGPPSVAVEIRAGKAARVRGDVRVTVEMCGTLPAGREAPLARAEIVLAERRDRGSLGLFHRIAGVYPHSPAEIYRSLLFHGPDMQGIARIDGCTEHGVSGWVKTAPAPVEWIARPTRGRWLFNPLAIDCAFQLVVLWCRKQLEACSLPTAVRSYRQFHNHFPADGVRVVAEIREAGESRALADVEFLDAKEDRVAVLAGYECVIDQSLDQAFRRNALGSAGEVRSASAHVGATSSR
jgi:acyl transferase domain-containing protein/NAD(P)-dependent dehydrogenase (short-subunit alcohol dehydrogenase family)